MLIFLGLVLFVLLVVVHEYGHFIAARRNGVEVEEVGLGFPPRAKLLTKKNGTEYTLNWLPLGGFVKLKGENDSDRSKNSFGATSLWNKTKIIAAGVVMNWLAAIVIFGIVALLGMPQLVENQFQIKSDAQITKQEVFVGAVEAGSPAQKSGLRVNDKIVSIANQKIKSSRQLITATKAHRGKNVAVAIERDGKTKLYQVALKNNPQGGNLGVSPGEQTLVRSTWSAPLVGVGTTAQLSYETTKGVLGAIGNLFTARFSEAGKSVTGPVGIVVVLNNLAKQCILFVLFLIGVRSLSFAVMNVLPIPALDGGRLFVMYLFRIMKKPLSKKTEDRIHGTGMFVLLLFALLITIIDIKRI